MHESRSILRAFTLIELLIVVAIITILAAIAIPNYMNAQTRSKISRVLADMRNATVGIETYKIDRNSFPAYTGREAAYFIPWDKEVGDPPYDPANGASLKVFHFLTPLITTPVAYMSTVFKDVFVDPNMAARIPPPLEYQYYARPYSPNLMLSAEQSLFHGQSGYSYVILSPGPDLIFDEGRQFYDPTNGTESVGDVMRWGPGE